MSTTPTDLPDPAATLVRKAAPAPPPMLESLTPRAWQIVRTARTLLERDGMDGLSMHRIAAALGIRAPSLYKHVENRRILENYVIILGLWEHGSLLIEAAEGAEDPLWEIAMAHRQFVLDHPHLYQLMGSRPIGDDPASQAASFHDGIALRAATDGDLEAARLIWGFAHGLALIELRGRAPGSWDLLQLWREGITRLRGTTC